MIRRIRSQIEFLRGQEQFRDHPLQVARRLLAWRLKCWLGTPTELALEGLDIKIFLPPEWRGIAKLVYLFREHCDKELCWFRSNLKHGDTVVDGGANIGVYTAVASKAVGENGLVFAFEPAAMAFATLQHNVAINGATNVRPIQMALSDTSGEASLFLHNDPSQNSLADSGGERAEMIETITLDQVLEEHGVHSVDLIKLDVEGAEQLALAGASRLFKRDRPIVLLEVNNRASISLGRDGLGGWRYLEELGYEFYGLAPDGHLIRLGVAPTTIANVIAKPPAG